MAIPQKKIMLVSNELTYTGAPTSLLRIAKVLKKNHYDLVVYSANDGPFKKEFQNYSEVKIVKSPAECLERIKDFKLAIVNTIALSNFAELLSKYIPTIWYIREAQSIYRYFDKDPNCLKILKKFKKLYCVSEYAAGIISKINPNVQVLHNCVEDYSNLALPHSIGTKIRFIQLGTIDKRKGFDVILNAYALLSDYEKQHCEFYFAGQYVPIFAEYYKEFLKECKKNNSIYLGEIKNIEERVKLCSRMDVFIVASRDESCSLTALESAMLSKPVIVTKNVGAKYIVSSDSGFIVDTGSVSSLKNAISFFINNPNKIKEMGKNARRNYEKTSTMKIYEKNITRMVSTEDKYNIQIKLSNNFWKLEKYIYDAYINYSSRENIIKKIMRKTERPIRCSKKSNQEIIVSLTSYPPRIQTVYKTIKTIYNQTLKADRIQLWLAESDFPNKDQDLPHNLLKLKKRGLEIHWCDDLGPHKKYFYSTKNNPRSIIITVDDDVYYSKNLISTLYHCYQCYPHYISAMRVHRIIFDSNSNIKPYSKWIKEDKTLYYEPSYQAIATGVGGVLYPPGVLPTITYNKEAIINYSLYADDIWLKLCEIINEVPTVLASKNSIRYEIKDTQKEALFKENVLSNRNDTVLKQSISYLDKHIESNLKSSLQKSIESNQYWTPLQKQSNKIAVICPVSEKLTAHNGDYHYCSAIVKYFKRNGFDAELRTVEHWYEEYDGKYILVLRGSKEYHVSKYHYNIMWNISHPERINTFEYTQYDLILIASEYWTQLIQQKLPNKNIFFMPQCTDAELFYRPYSETKLFQLLFVGYAHEEGRKIIEDLLPTKYDLSVYGPRWKGKIDSKYIKGEMINNSDLAEYYNKSTIVLNDHLNSMRNNGFVSNRIYDVYAAGGFVISDNVQGLNNIITDAVYYVNSQDLNEKIEYYLSQEDLIKNNVKSVQKEVLTKHTFDCRIKQIIALLDRYS